MNTTNDTTQPIESPESTTPKWMRVATITAAFALVAGMGIFIGNLFNGNKVENVYPDAPRFVSAQACGVEHTVEIPEVKGVDYTATQDGYSLAVEASPASKDYRLTGGARTVWTYDLTPTSCEPATSNEGSANDAQPEEDYVGDFLDSAKDKGKDVLEWTKEYGPGIWDKTKEFGSSVLSGIENWAKS